MQHAILNMQHLPSPSVHPSVTQVDQSKQMKLGSSYSSPIPLVFAG